MKVHYARGASVGKAAASLTGHRSAADRREPFPSSGYHGGIELIRRSR
ncbi:hypothetical protein [Kolteria novifilia]